MNGQQHAPAAIYPRERHGTNFTGGWVGPRAGLDGCGKSRPHRDSIPDRLARSSVSIPTEPPGARNTVVVSEIATETFNRQTASTIGDR